MNKLAFTMAYMDPETACELFNRYHNKAKGLEKTAAIDKEAFIEDIGKWLKKTWASPKGRKVLMGLIGGGLGAGVGSLMGGRKGALWGAGLGGLGGYFYGHHLFGKSPAEIKHKYLLDKKRNALLDARVNKPWYERGMRGVVDPFGAMGDALELHNQTLDINQGTQDAANEWEAATGNVNTNRRAWYNPMRAVDWITGNDPEPSHIGQPITADDLEAYKLHQEIN